MALNFIMPQGHLVMTSPTTVNCNLLFTGHININIVFYFTIVFFCAYTLTLMATTRTAKLTEFRKMIIQKIAVYRTLILSKDAAPNGCCISQTCACVLENAARDVCAHFFLLISKSLSGPYCFFFI